MDLLHGTIEGNFLTVCRKIMKLNVRLGHRIRNIFCYIILIKLSLVLELFAKNLVPFQLLTDNNGFFPNKC